MQTSLDKIQQALGKQLLPGQPGRQDGQHGAQCMESAQNGSVNDWAFEKYRFMADQKRLEIIILESKMLPFIEGAKCLEYSFPEN